MDIVMGWPEWIIVAMIALGVTKRMVLATGKRVEDTTHNGVYAVSIITYPAFWLGLLYWGGFFS